MHKLIDLRLMILSQLLLSASCSGDLSCQLAKNLVPIWQIDYQSVNQQLQANARVIDTDRINYCVCFLTVKRMRWQKSIDKIDQVADLVIRNAKTGR